MKDGAKASMPSWSPARVHAVIGLLACRWVIAILHTLDAGPIRRNALREQLGQVSDKVLTDTLRRLEAAGWVKRTLTAGVPARVDYELTPEARTLWPLFEHIDRWAAEHLRPPAERSRTPLTEDSHDVTPARRR